jgi:eukaryotic-like serine/threonine-protein kinase
MAKVYRAVVRGAAGFQRFVALKRIRETLIGGAEFVDMFIEEARVCAELSHGNIVQVLDFGVDEHGYFLVMEWVDGVHFGEYLESLARRGLSLPSRHAAAIGAQVLAGLSAAHERVDDGGKPVPVIHRDVTPQNILLSVGGVAKLTDFGLARAMDRASNTAPDVIKGKLSYLAPEIVLGAQASVQSDLYSLGVVLWEALTGERLFWGDSPGERVRKAREATIPPLLERRSSLPPALVGIVERALRREPAERFPSAQAMHDALVLSMGERLVSARELSDAVVEARIALGLAPRSARVPASTPPGANDDVVTRPVVVVKTKSLG